MTPDPSKTGRKRTDVGPGRPPKEHQFKKGNPGGPGRPKGVSVSTQIRKILETEGEAEEVARAIIKKAKAGDPQAFKALMDRYEGPVVQEIEANIGGPVEEITDEGLSRIARLIGEKDAEDAAQPKPEASHDHTSNGTANGTLNGTHGDHDE